MGSFGKEPVSSTLLPDPSGTSVEDGDSIRLGNGLSRNSCWNARDSDGATPLHTAAACGCAKIVELLVTEGAGVVDVLIRQGADVNAKNERGVVSLHGAVRGAHTEVVALLIAKGADVNARASGIGFTPLFLVSSADDPNGIVRLLCANGADPDTKDESNMAPLHHAARDGRADFARALLSNGADPDIQGRASQTPLHLAAAKGNIEVVEVLLASGADANARDKDGSTPLNVARTEGYNQEGYNQVVWSLRKHGAK